MRRTTTIGFGLALFCAACEQDGGIPNEQCESRATQAACEGLSAEQWHCAWVDVRSSTGTCEAETTTESSCITLTYQGAGCLNAHACGASEGPNVYVRDAGEAGVQVFQLETCEYQPDLEWRQCVWTDMDVSPNPACACSC
jgi:hypothetical protein